MTAPERPKGSGSAQEARRPRWRRRIKRVLLALLVLLVVLRISLVFIVPVVLRKAAGAYGLTCTYDRLDMNLLATDVGLWRLALTPRAGGVPVVSVEYVRGDVSPFALLRGRLHVRRAVADGVELVLDRDADGSIPWLAPLLSGGSRPQPAKSEGPLKLSSPLGVDAFRLANIRARFRDRSVAPALDASVRLNLSVSDLGDPLRPVRFSAELMAAPALDYARVEGEASMAEAALDADWHVLVRGLHPGPLAGYLRPLGIEPRAQDIGAQMSGQVQLRVPATRTLAGALTVSDAAVVADGRESFGLKGLTVVLDRLTSASAQLSAVTVDGATFRAERSADGKLRVAGLELAGAPPAATPNPPSAADPPKSPLAWGIKELTLRDCRADFHDEAVVPATDLALVLDEAALRNLGVDPVHADAPADLTLSAEAPGVARALKVTASARPSATPAAVDAQLSVEGIDPEALRPYLERMGLESQLKDADLSCGLHAAWQKGADGRLAADLAVEGIDFRDGAELFSAGGLRVTGADYDPRSGAVQVQAIDVQGPHLSVHREESGALALLGLRVQAHGAGPAPAKTGAPAQEDPPTPLPPISIGRFSWKDVDVRWQDDMVKPAVALEVADAGVEVTDLNWDPARADAEAKPVAVHAWLAAPGLLDGLDVQGSVTPGRDRLSAEMSVTGKGVSGRAVAPYLAAAGIEPVLQGGGLHLHGLITATRGADGWDTSLDVRDAAFTDGGQELAALDRLSVKDVTAVPGRLGVGGVEVVRPRLHAERDADGTLIVSGVRLLPRPPQAVPKAEAASQVVTLGRLSVQEAGLSWLDRAMTPALSTSAAATLELDGLTVGAPAPPAKLSLTVSAPGSVDELTASGTVSADPDAPAVALVITGKGLRAGPLSAYVPAGMEVTLRDGSAHAAFSAGMEPNPQGGSSAHVQLTDLLLTDAPEAGVATAVPESTPLLKLDSAKLDVSRWDPEAGILAVDEASSNGLEMDVEKGGDGSTSLLGLKLGPKAAAVPAADPEQVKANGPVKVPLITLDKLDLQVGRLSYRDAGHPGAAPLALADLRLQNTARIECLGPDAADRPPVKLQLTGRIDPLVESLKVDVSAAPFAGEPSLQVDFLADGISGAGLTALAPELKSRLDGSPLTAGELSFSVDLGGSWRRRLPWDFDLARGANLHFLIKDVAYRASPDGPVLLGLDELRADGIQVLPGGRGTRVRSVEVTSPRAHVWRDQDGLHVLGCVLPAGTETPVPAEQPPAVASTEAAPAAQPPAAAPPPEFTIDSFTIAGVDVLLEDRSCDPALIVPLTGLDVEARDISTRALTEDRPVHFSVLASSGKVPLPKRPSGGGVAGAVGGVLGMLTGTRGDGSTSEMEDRDLFSQLTASGTIGLYPAPNGWAKFALDGLDLAAFGGEAKARNITLDRGTLDFSVDVRFADDGNLDAHTRTVLNDLRIAEPANGPISRYLSLPAPLDVAIRALQDADGSITLPLSVPVKAGDVSTASLRLKVITVLSRVVATALASAPVKAVGGVGSLVGLTGGGTAPRQEQIVLGFAPGVTAPAAGDLARLEEVARRVRGDGRIQVSLRHELGAQDLPIAQERANPSPDECLALAHQLQQRRAELAATRRQLAGEGEAQLASGAPQQSATLEHLRGVDVELARTDDALDRLYDLTRPGADRQADRRTRAAALEIGQERLEAVRRQLVGADAGRIADRVHVVRATVNPSEGNAGGQVTITLMEPRRSGGIFPLNLLSGLFRAVVGLVS